MNNLIAIDPQDGGYVLRQAARSELMIKLSTLPSRLWTALGTLVGAWSITLSGFTPYRGSLEELFIRSPRDWSAFQAGRLHGAAPVITRNSEAQEVAP